MVAPLLAGAISSVLASPAGAADIALWVQGSPSSMPVGVAIYNVATVGLGVNPTGTLTSSLYGPNDATCSRPAIFTASTPVSGNGNYQSAWYTTSAAGSYRWVVAYSGDAANSTKTSGCADPQAEVVVSRRTPRLSVIATMVPTTGVTTATATLDKGAGLTGPKGTISFRLYGPNNAMCGGAPVFTSTRSVSGNGTYTSDPFTPTAAGTYQWVLSYSGDADNWGAMTVCGDLAGAVVATPRLLTPTLALAPPATAHRGEPVRATASLGAGLDPTGTITFDVFGQRDAACAARPISTSRVPMVGNGTYTSASFTPPGPGTYRWVASYDGDIGHAPAATTCGQRDSTTAVAQVTDDYDGDGDTDVAIFRPSNGGWYLKGIASVSWGGVPGDVPVPGDYDGDGDTDVAIYRPSNGGWYFNGIGFVAWGVAGDVPVPGDYDGDGRTDPAVYRPSNGGWYVRGASAVAWGGVPGDIPVAGDYDGDGRTDVAIYRPSNGGWYLQGIGSMAWGVPGDIPVAGDYDGDGDTDPGVYRPSNGGWYLQGIGAVAWGGVPGDLALTLPTAIRWFLAGT